MTVAYACPCGAAIHYGVGHTCALAGYTSKPGVESEVAVRPSPSDGPMAEADTGSPPRDTRTCNDCGDAYINWGAHAERCYGRPRGVA